MSTKQQHIPYGQKFPYGSNKPSGTDGPTPGSLPAELSEATWQRLEALIRRVVSDAVRNTFPREQASTPVQPPPQVETPSLSAQVSVPRDEEEKSVKEEKKADPRPRMAYGTHIWEVDEKGNRVQVS